MTMMTYLEEFAEYRAGHRSRPNPFKRDADGSIRSMMGVSALIQTDPDLAKRLCLEAGENVTAWFPENPL